MNSDLIQISPIGFTRARISEQQTGGFVGIQSQIELKPAFSEYLDGLREYSHIHVIYWLSEMTESLARTRPQGNPEVPTVGMFACR